MMEQEEQAHQISQSPATTSFSARAAASKASHALRALLTARFGSGSTNSTTGTHPADSRPDSNGTSASTRTIASNNSSSNNHGSTGNGSSDEISASPASAPILASTSNSASGTAFGSLASINEAASTRSRTSSNQSDGNSKSNSNDSSHHQSSSSINNTHLLNTDNTTGSNSNLSNLVGGSNSNLHQHSASSSSSSSSSLRQSLATLAQGLTRSTTHLSKRRPSAPVSNEHSSSLSSSSVTFSSGNFRDRVLSQDDSSKRNKASRSTYDSNVIKPNHQPRNSIRRSFNNLFSQHNNLRARSENALNNHGGGGFRKVREEDLCDMQENNQHISCHEPGDNCPSNPQELERDQDQDRRRYASATSLVIINHPSLEAQEHQSSDREKQSSDQSSSLVDLRSQAEASDKTFNSVSRHKSLFKGRSNAVAASHHNNEAVATSSSVTGSSPTLLVNQTQATASPPVADVISTGKDSGSASSTGLLEGAKNLVTIRRNRTSSSISTSSNSGNYGNTIKLSSNLRRIITQKSERKSNKEKTGSIYTADKEKSNYHPSSLSRKHSGMLDPFSGQDVSHYGSTESMEGGINALPYQEEPSLNPPPSRFHSMQHSANVPAHIKLAISRLKQHEQESQSSQQQHHHHNDQQHEQNRLLPSSTANSSFSSSASNTTTSTNAAASIMATASKRSSFVNLSPSASSSSLYPKGQQGSRSQQGRTSSIYSSSSSSLGVNNGTHTNPEKTKRESSVLPQDRYPQAASNSSILGHGPSAKQSQSNQQAHVSKSKFAGFIKQFSRQDSNSMINNAAGLDSAPPNQKMAVGKVMRSSSSKSSISGGHVDSSRGSLRKTPSKKGKRRSLNNSPAFLFSQNIITKPADGSIDALAREKLSLDAVGVLQKTLMNEESSSSAYASMIMASSPPPPPPLPTATHHHHPAPSMSPSPSTSFARNSNNSYQNPGNGNGNGNGSNPSSPTFSLANSPISHSPIMSCSTSPSSSSITSSDILRRRFNIQNKHPSQMNSTHRSSVPLPISPLRESPENNAPSYSISNSSCENYASDIQLGSNSGRERRMRSSSSSLIQNNNDAGSSGDIPAFVHNTAITASTTSSSGSDASSCSTGITPNIYDPAPSPHINFAEIFSSTTTSTSNNHQRLSLNSVLPSSPNVQKSRSFVMNANHPQMSSSYVPIPLVNKKKSNYMASGSFGAHAADVHSKGSSTVYDQTQGGAIAWNQVENHSDATIPRSITQQHTKALDMPTNNVDNFNASSHGIHYVHAHLASS